MEQIIYLLQNYTTENNLIEISKYILPISATLLGLIYVASIYWLQSGFQELEYSKSLLEDILITNAKLLFDLLIGNSIICLLIIMKMETLITLAYWCFMFVFVKDLMNNIADRGYLTTLNSRKFIPSKYGAVRSYFRKIRNAGLVGIIRMSYFLTPIIIYPVYLSIRDNTFPYISESALTIFIFITCGFGLLQVKPLLTEAFDIKKTISKSMMNDNEMAALTLEEPKIKWSKMKMDIESKILQERLLYLGIPNVYDETDHLEKWTSRDLSIISTMNDARVNDDGTVHINFYLPYFLSDVEIRNYLFHWARAIFTVFAKSKTDASYYSLSFFRKTEERDMDHLALFRGSRSEVMKNENSESNEAFIKALKGKSVVRFISEIKTENV
ncbi:hypothetical protein [Fusibacter sp. JL216-2]|uniref:hypothetical protein n=1 Tax=Fusibacter sp. JL216-2 TaxID=3071453 RepID=UPI003D327B2C